MEIFFSKIKELRPSLSDSSCKTYGNILKNVFYDLNTKETPADYKYFIDNIERVLEYLINTKTSVRKTYLSALIVISQENLDIQKKYRELMKKDSTEHRALRKTLKMSEVN